MTLTHDTAEAAVSSGEERRSDTDTVVSPDPGLATVAWIARHFRRPFTEAAVMARLPRGTDLNAVAGLARAFAAVGLKSRTVLRDITLIDPIAFPVILPCRQDTPCSAFASATPASAPSSADIFSSSVRSEGLLQRV